MLLIFCIFIFFSQSFAQDVSLCPNIKSKNFDTYQVLDRWLEWAHTPNAFETPNPVCSVAELFLNKKNVMEFRVKKRVRLSGAVISFSTELHPTKENGVYISSNPKYPDVAAVKLTFVDANYGHWMIHHYCSQNFGKIMQTVMVYTNKITLSKQEEMEISNALKRINLSVDNLQKTDNTRCPIN